MNGDLARRPAIAPARRRAAAYREAPGALVVRGRDTPARTEKRSSTRRPTIAGRAASPQNRASLPAILAAASLALAGCILDLDHLTGGETAAGGSSTTGSTAGAGGSTAGAGGGTTSGTGGAGGSSCAILQCGACEGACDGGVCPPVVLANGPGLAEGPQGIAAAPGAVYWVNQTAGTVVRVRDGDAGPTIIAENAKSPRAVAAGADLVFWSADDGLWSCPPDDCEAQKKNIAPSISTGSLREIAYDGALVFWTDRGSAPQASDGAVMRCVPESCQPEAIEAAQIEPAGLALSGATILWAYSADGFPSGHIYRQAKLGMGEDDLAAGLTLPTGVAADDVYVYWTEWTATGHVRRCAFAGGFCQVPDDVAPAAGALGHPRDVVAAGGRVYFSTTDDGTIRSCPAPGCAPGAVPKVHAAAREGLHRIAAGSSCLFFTDETNGGSVLKVAR